MLLFDESYSACISLHPGSEESVALAARDLQRDLRILCDRADGFDILFEYYTSPGSIELGISEGEPESYRIEITEDSISIKGADSLGLVYGIYAFSAAVLGFSPMYPLTELRPPVRSTLTAEPAIITSKPHPTSLRGWFLNDEDLLGEWLLGKGERSIDYPFYKRVMHTDALDRVLECALRLEINLIIPSSFVDIMNPAEEELVAAVCRRGLYISQHHVEPLGVSYFAAEAYVKEHGKVGESVSFVSNRPRMEEIWRVYAKKWAAYGEKVVWQLGLRGKADQAVWQADPRVPTGSSERGRIISDAIAAQHAIISEVLDREDFPSTVTLWFEGAELYRGGHLTLPESTAVIFSDVGLSQLFGDDFYTTERDPNRRYGIYYHVGYWSMGPHLAEGCDPHKMAFSYSEAKKRDSLSYALLNVSNVRPLHLGAELSSRLLDEPTLSARTALRRIFKPIFGSAADIVLDLYDEYFAAFADLGSTELMRLCNKFGFSYHRYGRLLFPEFPATDGELCDIARALMSDASHLTDYVTAAASLEQSEKKFAAVLDRMTATERHLTPEALDYFRRFMKFPALYMMRLTRFTLSVWEMMNTHDEHEMRAAHDRGVAAMRSILEERKILEQGAFEGWHRGDSKIGIKKLLDDMEKTYERLSLQL